MIIGHGYQDAKILLIADGGSDDDIASGKALSGYQGSIISGLMRDNGMSIEETYRTCLIKERINLAVPEANKELLTQKYLDILENEINTIRPNLIIPLAELSFNFVCGLSGIRKFRGSLLPSSNKLGSYRVLPILGPYPYLNQEEWLTYISRLDFAKASRERFVTGPIQEIGNCWVAENSSQVRQFFERHYKNAPFATMDIETYMGIPTCISFCLDGIESMCVPLLDFRIPVECRALMGYEVARFLQSPLGKVNQNIKFDWKKLDKWAFRVNNVVGDTLIAASCLYPEFPKNLGFLTSIYTEIPYFKDEGKEFDPAVHDRKRLYLYCAKDSLATFQIYQQQLNELVETGTGGVYQKLIKVLPIYKRMEERGVRIDTQQREALIAKYEARFDVQLYKLRKLLNDDDFNPLSSKQCREVVYDQIGYRKVRGIKYTTKGGEPGVDEESLEVLIYLSDHKAKIYDAQEILRTIIACKKLHKVLEILDTPTHLDQRWRGEWNLGGTNTGRTSGGTTTDSFLRFHKKIKKVEVKDLGHSWQNIGKHGFEVDGEPMGKDIRSMFIPSDGYCFVECDLSQAEARVDAVLARDYNILPIFDSSIGIHRLTGSWLFDCPPEEIKKNTLVDGIDRYHQAKTARHAGERNMREDRLMTMIHRPINECIKILKKFHENQPNIKKVFHQDIHDILKETRVLTAPNGRRRQFFDDFNRNRHHIVNEGISFLPQAIVSDQLKFGLIGIYEDCGGFAEPLVEAHDGHLAEVKIDKKEEFVKSFKKYVEIPIDFRNCSLSRDFELVIPSEAEWSDTNWAEMKELKI